PDLPDGCYACVTVRDDGCGMSETTAGQVFEPFFTTKAPGAGTGLGLSVVHGIMTSHQGGVMLSSREGEGTAVRLYFPAADAALPEPSALPEEAPARGRRVLYVDDEQALVLLASRVLRRLGIEVSGYTDA